MYDATLTGNILIVGRTACGKAYFTQKLVLNRFFGRLKIDTSSFEESDGNGFGEKATRDRLIVMDDVLGLADESKKFASFLTVARKFNYMCFYIFHIIYPENKIWRTILPQTSIFNIFLASVSLSHARRILKNVCLRKTRKYIPLSSLWISRPFIELTNRNDRICLILDCSGINKEGPDRFRTEADKPVFEPVILMLLVMNTVIMSLLANA